MFDMEQLDFKNPPEIRDLKADEWTWWDLTVFKVAAYPLSFLPPPRSP